MQRRSWPGMAACLIPCMILCSVWWVQVALAQSDEAVLHLRKGDQLFGKGKVREAISAYQKAYRAYPAAARFNCKRAETLYKIGLAWRSLGKTSNAKSALFRAARSSGCRNRQLTGRAWRSYRALVRVHTRNKHERRRPRRRRMRVKKPKKARRLPSPTTSAPPMAIPRARRARMPKRLRQRILRAYGRRTSSLRERLHRRLHKRLRRRLRRSPRPAIGMDLSSRRESESSRRTTGKKKNKKNPKVQVWQRSKSNTILSRVSVGGKKQLKLEKLRINIQIDGMRARTTIDHIYSNPYNRTLQGTFKYTLPPDASVSYYAMFVGNRRRQVPRFFTGKSPGARLNKMRPSQIARTNPHKHWGKLREARMVPAEKGRQVYEEITRQRIDPALLEQDAPNTFTGRVFPIRPKGFNRVIIAYEQTLPQVQGEHVYRFRFPPQVAKFIDFSMDINPKHSHYSRTNLRALRCRHRKALSTVRCYWEQNKPKKDAVFYLKPKNKALSVIAGVDPLDGKKYLLSQVRVSLPQAKAKHSREQALFLLDTSLSAHPDLFAKHLVLLKQILQQNKGIKRFNVLCFDVATRWIKPSGWISNDASTRGRLLARLGRIVLEGATNLGAAFAELARPSWYKRRMRKDTDVFVLSDAQVNWGSRQIDPILERFHKRQGWGQVRFFAYQTGVGSENLALLRRIVRSGGALFPCLAQSELRRCATAHTRASLLLESVKIEGINASQVMIAGRQTSVYPGALITVAAQYLTDGKATFVLKGRYLGKPYKLRREVRVQTRGDLSPRAWGEMVIAQLLELEDPSLTKLIVAYAQHFHIPNKHSSLLVLETDKEYKQYGLDKMKKAKKLSDVALFLERVWKNKGRAVTMRERWILLARKVAKRDKFLYTRRGRAILQMLRTLPESDFAFPDTNATKIWERQMVPASYLKQRERESLGFRPFVQEAKHRLKREAAGAIRALSCIVEKNPSNPKALRLVAYYLRAWNRPALAAQVFWEVLERRSFEPHAFRDVAISLLRMKRYGLAAVLYEIMLGGRWHRRFGRFKTLAREEYALLIYGALKGQKLPYSVRRKLATRRSMLGYSLRPTALRVTVTWNTDSTDIDLWVTGPGGKCYYRRKATADGGRLLQDITRGYGPERYANATPQSGRYDVQLHYYGHRSNTFGNETHVSVMIVRYGGTKRQSITFKSLILRKAKSVTSVGHFSL